MTSDDTKSRQRESLLRAQLYNMRVQDIKGDHEALGRLLNSDCSVLEIGSGTGRVLSCLSSMAMPVIDGIEKDREFCAFARQRVDEKSVITINEGDFLSFDFDNRYDYVLFSFNVLGEFLDVRSRLAAVSKAKNILTERGKVIFFNPYLDPRKPLERNVTYRITLADEPGAPSAVWYCEINCVLDYVCSTSRCTVTYTMVDRPDNTVEDSYCVALMSRSELLAIFYTSGLRVLQEFGSYALEDVNEKSELLIHVCETATPGNV